MHKCLFGLYACIDKYVYTRIHMDLCTGGIRLRGLWPSASVIGPTPAEAMKTLFICPVVRSGTMISS